MLWYLHLCAETGVEVTAYVDEPRGTMEEAADGSGRFVRDHLDLAIWHGLATRAGLVSWWPLAAQI